MERMIKKMGYQPVGARRVYENLWSVTFSTDDDAHAFGDAARALGHEPRVISSQIAGVATVRTTL